MPILQNKSNILKAKQGDQAQRIQKKAKHPTKKEVLKAPRSDHNPFAEALKPPQNNNYFAEALKPPQNNYFAEALGVTQRQQNKQAQASTFQNISASAGEKKGYYVLKRDHVPRYVVWNDVVYAVEQLNQDSNALVYLNTRGEIVLNIKKYREIDPEAPWETMSFLVSTAYFEETPDGQLHEKQGTTKGAFDMQEWDRITIRSYEGQKMRFIEKSIKEGKEDEIFINSKPGIDHSQGLSEWQQIQVLAGKWDDIQASATNYKTIINQYHSNWRDYVTKIRKAYSDALANINTTINGAKEVSQKQNEFIMELLGIGLVYAKLGKFLLQVPMLLKFQKNLKKIKNPVFNHVSGLTAAKFKEYFDDTLEKALNVQSSFENTKELITPDTFEIALLDVLDKENSFHNKIFQEYHNIAKIKEQDDLEMIQQEGRTLDLPQEISFLYEMLYEYNDAVYTFQSSDYAAGPPANFDQTEAAKSIEAYYWANSGCITKTESHTKVIYNPTYGQKVIPGNISYKFTDPSIEARVRALLHEMGELPQDAHPARYYDWSIQYTKRFAKNNFAKTFFIGHESK